MGHMPSDLSSPLAELAQQAASSYRAKPTDQPVMSPAFLRLLTHVLHQASLQAGRQVAAAEVLSAGMRSVVVRVTWAGPALPAPRGRTAVLKYFRRRDSATNSGGFGYLREKHGLPALAELMPGLYPQLLTADDEHRLLILEDVSGSPSPVSLGDLMLSTGADATPHQALTAWADTWASILSSPAQATTQASFSAELARADARASAPGSLPSPQLAFKGLHLLAERQGVAVGSAEFAHMERAVASIIYPAPSERVLSSGDFSPANLLVTLPTPPPGAGAGPSLPLPVRGIDAEGTCLHHWALPLAEMLLGFPSWPEGPLPPATAQSPSWRGVAQELYRRICPTPQADMDADPRLAAAYLTIRAILAEQTAGQGPQAHP
ncbi:hypothetical protein [Rothia nasimurium]|uniref:hypothetical protein n=1 Tax=Rothia nasimurium TaxID=85336 RepID=UPI003B9DF55C